MKVILLNSSEIKHSTGAILLLKRTLIFLSATITFSLLNVGCHTVHVPHQSDNKDLDVFITSKYLAGGSSGMEQVSDSSYLVVYDLKLHHAGPRVGYVKLSNGSLDVIPVVIEHWDENGIANDLESICKIPGRKDEFLVAEAGNWKGDLGRIFQIKVNFSTFEARVLGTIKIPMLRENDLQHVGDQYEAMYCMKYRDDKNIIFLFERGGSTWSPTGIIRWGIWDMTKNSFDIEGAGLTGIRVNAPGYWTDESQKRSITDVHVDRDGILWASASEDQGDAGPFYSVIYKIGIINNDQPDQPVRIFQNMLVGKEIHGFKIEALSGPAGGMACTHSFGTEDENHIGVWRPIALD